MKARKALQIDWDFGPRADESKAHDFYRPVSYHRISGAVDVQGQIAAWEHRSTSTSIASWWDRANPAESQELGSTLQMPYLMKNYKLEYAPADSGVPRASWRSVEASFIGFVMESYMDELPHAAGADSLEFRLRHLDPARKVANAIDRKDANPLVCACMRVERIVSAVDIGTIVSPDGARAQVESAAVYGLTAALKSRITIQNGRAVETNFHHVTCLKMDETPHIEVHFVPSDLAPTGIGGPGLPPVAPAVMNAVFAAKGKRVRHLPLTSDDLRA